MDLRVNHFQQFDFRLQKLRELAARVEPYQPAYGLPGLIAKPARDSVDRCRAIENHFSGRLRGKRLLDVGSSLGYVCYYFADRGMADRGLGGQPVQHRGRPADRRAERPVQPHPHAAVRPRQRRRPSRPGEFDVVTLLSVLHHVVYHQGLEQTQQLMRDLLRRVPVLVLELARKGEDPELFWDAALPEDELDILALVRDEVEIVPLGMFDTHLSDKARPLYVVARKETVTRQRPDLPGHPLQRRGLPRLCGGLGPRQPPLPVGRRPVHQAVPGRRPALGERPVDHARDLGAAWASSTCPARRG